MVKIDTSEWKEYRMSDLGFTVCHGSRITKAERVEGDTVFLTAGFENCGVVGTIGNENIDVWEKPITVDMFGNVFYHDETCAGDDNIYAFLNSKLSRTAKLFVASSIASVTQSKYSYQQQFRQGDANKLSVYLPATPDGAPDWAYMESYMANLETKVADSLTLLQAAKDAEKKKVDTREWGEFRVGELFKTQMKGKKIQVPTGANVPMQDMIKDGSTPRITVTGVNNGVFGLYDYCGKNSTEYRVFRNFISVSFLGTVFYQEGEATLDMKVHCLQPNHITLNKYTGNFLVSAIKASLRKSSYSDQISSTILPEMTIMLPKDKTGQPDWAYMEEYMRKVEERVKKTINTFCVIRKIKYDC